MAAVCSSSWRNGPRLGVEILRLHGSLRRRPGDCAAWPRPGGERPGGRTTRARGSSGPPAGDHVAVDTPRRQDITALPPGSHLALMAVGTVAVGTSGPLIVATAVPALAIAFWRNAFGAAAVSLPALLRRGSRAELTHMPSRLWLFAGLAGLLLAAHFGTWIPSLDYTSVTSFIALVSTQPIWAALLARLAGFPVPGRVWLGI